MVRPPVVQSIYKASNKKGGGNKKARVAGISRNSMNSGAAILKLVRKTPFLE